MPDDPDLRERFAALRREDREHAGEFGTFLHPAKPHPHPIRASAWIVVAAGMAVTIAAVVLSPGRMGRRHTAVPETSITEWKSPTDFLLRTPGQELLRTVPRIGEWPVAAQDPAGRRKPSVPRKSSSKKSLTRLIAEERLS